MLKQNFYWNMKKCSKTSQNLCNFLAKIFSLLIHRQIRIRDVWSPTDPDMQPSFLDSYNEYSYNEYAYNEQCCGAEIIYFRLWLRFWP